MLAFYVGIISFYESNSPATFQLILTRMLLMFAAIYVMVRALDNIGLEGSSLEGRWNGMFEG